MEIIETIVPAVLKRGASIMQGKGTSIAVKCFQAGYNCSQSTLAGVLAEFGQGYKSRMDLAVGFQSGIAQTGKMCGCLSGIIMATGLIVPRKKLDLAAWKQKVSDVSREMMELFIDEFGSLNCSEIAGCDMSDEATRKHFLIESQGRQRICEPMVGKSVDIAVALLRKHAHENH